MIPYILVALLGGLTAWFGVAWFQSLSAERAKTDLERRQDRINRETDRLRRPPLKKRLRSEAYRFGWNAPIGPLAVLGVFVYLAVSVGVAVLGVAGWLAVILAVPLTAVIITFINSSIQNKRQAAFQVQLISAFDQFSAALRASASPAGAIEATIPGLPEPLRSELVSAMDAHRAGRELHAAFADIAVRYPSRAMDLFVVALRMDDKSGGPLASALAQAAETLRRDSELGAEAAAELSQERLQFLGIVGIVSLIAVFTLTRSSADARAVFFTPVGFSLLMVFVGNFVFGVYRILRILNKVRGGKI